MPKPAAMPKTIKVGPHVYSVLRKPKAILKGLGHKFLRHIKRTKTLLHCLSLESTDLAKDYKVIRNELKVYSEDLADKKEVLILTKTDLVDEKTLEKAVKKMSKFNSEILTVTILDDKSVKSLKDNLIKILRKIK